MLTNPFVRQHVTIVDPSMDVDTINRMLAAAVSSTGFRNLLLGNPRAAAESGFAGECFELSSSSLDFLNSIRAASLRDFAEQVHARLPGYLATMM